MAPASACSDSYCSCESRVSSSPFPAVLATRSVTGDCGRATPDGDSRSVNLPDVPASFWLSPYSIPAAPPPAVGEADHRGRQSPLGTMRLESPTKVIPGKVSVEIFPALAWETCLASTT